MSYIHRTTLSRELHPEVTLMRLYSLVFVLLCSGLMVSCSGPGAPAGPKAILEFRKIERTTGGRERERDYAAITIRYPVVTGGVSAPVRDSINARITGMLLAGAVTDTLPASLEDAAARFVASYQAFAATISNPVPAWTQDLAVDAPCDTAGVLSLRLTNFSYTGGAHPATYVSFANLDLTTGRVLRLDDVLMAGGKEKVTVIAEQAFRRVRSLGASTPFDQEGFWFKENRFVLSENCSFRSDGIVVYYNPYEVAPYAAGPTEISIPYQHMRDYLASDSPLAPLAGVRQ